MSTQGDADDNDTNENDEMVFDCPNITPTIAVPLLEDATPGNAALAVELAILRARLSQLAEAQTKIADRSRRPGQRGAGPCSTKDTSAKPASAPIDPLDATRNDDEALQMARDIFGDFANPMASHPVEQHAQIVAAIFPHTARDDLAAELEWTRAQVALVEEQTKVFVMVGWILW